MSTVFLSYARGDDEAFVHRLRSDLVKAGFDVWFDRVSMPSRQLTFFQEIRDAIAARDRLVLVVGPHAAASEYVSQEWRHALELCKCVNPIVRSDGRTGTGATIDAYHLIPEELRLVHAEDFRDDARYAEHLANLLRQLSEPAAPLGKLVAVPSLPIHYRAQPERLNAVREFLLGDLRKPMVLSGSAAKVGMQGMGGIGKSVLASALARDQDVRRAFPDGVFWINVGQQASIVDLQRRLAEELGGHALFDDPRAGKQQLRELLQNRAALLILDNVWTRGQVDGLDAVGPRCKLLLTTRDAGLVTSFAGTNYQVELLTDSEATALLAAASATPIASLPAMAAEIAGQCGRLPLAIAVCGGMVRGGTPWRDVLDALREQDLQFLSDRHAAEEHHRSIWRTLEVSVLTLPEDQRRRFAELAVFAGGEKVPDAAVLRLWTHAGGLSERAARQLLTEFHQRSLVQLDQAAAAQASGSRLMSLHDLVHDFVDRFATATVGPSSALSQLLVDAYRVDCPDGWASGPNDGYFLAHLAQHLLRTGRTEEILALLFDFRWLVAKIGREHPHSLDRDFRLLLQSDAVPVTAEDRSRLAELREIVVALPSAGRLPATLWGHFANTPDRRLRKLLAQARDLTAEPWLRPITPSLATVETSLIHTIGDAGRVESLAVGDTADGDPIVAAVVDESPRRVRIWLGGARMSDVLVPDTPFLAKIDRPGDHAVTAQNLPGESRPALLHSWTETDRGTCCRLLDLSVATSDVSAHLSALLNHVEVSSAGPHGPHVIGSVMVLGEGTPRVIGTIAERLVVVAHLPKELPRLVRAGGEGLTAPDLVSIVSDEVFAEWRDLVVLNFTHSEIAADYVTRLEQLADSLTAALGDRVSVQPKEVVPARAVVWDVETGHPVPDLAWSIPDASRPVLIGETVEGTPFLVLADGDGRARLRKLSSPDSVELSWMSFADRPVLSRWHGRPAIVKGGLGEIEVVDASSGESVGRFSKHLDEETLLAAAEGPGGVPLVASVGRLGSRGRFSTSVRIWDARTQTQVSPTGTAHTEEIKAITSGTYRGRPVFATGSWNLICVWRAEAMPGYFDRPEPNEIPDPNLCGRVPLDQLPRHDRHHDLGAVALTGFNTISTWSAARSHTRALSSGHREWTLQPPGRDGRRVGVASSSIYLRKKNDVVSVWMSGESDRYSVIETTRRNGTVRQWVFSPRADWERQFSNWHYWHCVSVSGLLSDGKRVSIRVNPHYGDVTVDFHDGLAWKRLTYDPGCPATQCAFGEGCRSLVVFDERGIVHHLELVVPMRPKIGG